MKGKLKCLIKDEKLIFCYLTCNNFIFLQKIDIQTAFKTLSFPYWMYKTIGNKQFSCPLSTTCALTDISQKYYGKHETNIFRKLSTQIQTNLNTPIFLNYYTIKYKWNQSQDLYLSSCNQVLPLKITSPVDDRPSPVYKCIVWNAYSEMHTVKCILWNVYCEMYIMNFILWNLYC